MNLESYDLRVNQAQTVYMFDSIGRNGHITKIIGFNAINMPELEPLGFVSVYNLGFGDYDRVTGLISDTVKSNNGDRDKVLATVATAALDFLDKHSDLILYATGSTPERTRLYQIGLNRYYAQLENAYLIFGLSAEGWQTFEQKTNYKAFLLKRK